MPSPLEQIARFSDVPVQLDMELDRKIMSLESVLDWEPGSIVWLTRSAGENIDIYTGGTHLGYGEIVVIESTFGVRITDFAAPEEHE
jgi:flagellar motor switch protein FliN/FliY